MDTMDVQGAAARWWLVVLSGVAWMVYGFVVLSFSYRTVWAVAVFAGIGFLASGITELAIAAMVPRLRWLHVLLGLLGIVTGVLALVWPGTTFVVLARLVGWFLLIRGIVSLLSAFEARAQHEDFWWLLLVVGAVEIVVALWAVRYPGRSIVLLVLWVGIAALSRGITDIVLGFGLRRRPGGPTGPRPAVAV